MNHTPEPMPPVPPSPVPPLPPSPEEPMPPIKEPPQGPPGPPQPIGDPPATPPVQAHAARTVILSYVRISWRPTPTAGVRLLSRRHARDSFQISFTTDPERDHERLEGHPTRELHVGRDVRCGARASRP